MEEDLDKEKIMNSSNRENVIENKPIDDNRCNSGIKENEIRPQSTFYNKQKKI